MPLRSRSILLAVLIASGCSSSREIVTAPPRPAVAASTDSLEAPRARLTIAVETGQTALPAGLQALRFRIAEIRLRPSSGDWIAYPADANFFDVKAESRLRQTVLSADVLPAAYDSLGLVLSDVMAEYSPNAGGPLTLAREAPLVLPLALPYVEGRTTRLRLVFEPGASLSRTADCRWVFVPFFEPVTE